MMIASASLSTEIEVSLSDDEISRLESEIIQGELIFRNKDGKICNHKPLELVRSERSNHHYWANLETVPPGADFNAIEKYRILIYPRGYRKLVEGGYAGERIDAVSRADIFRE